VAALVAAIVCVVLCRRPAPSKDPDEIDREAEFITDTEDDTTEFEMMDTADFNGAVEYLNPVAATFVPESTYGRNEE
jgi:hypothetical protein